MNNNENDFGQKCPHCIGVCDKITGRSQEDKKLLSNRLNRIIGQLNGINRMIQEDEYPPKIMIQTSAAAAALSSFTKEVFTDFTKTCVLAHLKEGDSEVLDECMVTLKKMLD